MMARSVSFGSGAGGYRWVDRDGNEIEPNKSIADWSLYKLCRREHNIALGCRTLRIGNMSYYARFDDPDIGDDQEGVKIELRDHGGRMVPYHMMTGYNLIFCAATEPVTDFSDYDSCYRITDPVLFGQLIAGELIEQISPNDMQVFTLSARKSLGRSYGPETLAELSDIGFEVYRKEMRYLDPEEVTEDDCMMDGIPFWKAKTYAHQREFRYLFRPYGNGVTASLSRFERDYIDLDLSDIYDRLPVAAAEPVE